MPRRCDDSQNEDRDIQSISSYMTAVGRVESIDGFFERGCSLQIETVNVVYGNVSFISLHLFICLKSCQDYKIRCTKSEMSDSDIRNWIKKKLIHQQASEI